MPITRAGARTDRTTRYALQREAWPIPAHTQWHSTQDCRLDARYAVMPRGFCTLMLFIGSVCLFVKSHLTYGVSVRPENAVTYSADNEGQNDAASPCIVGARTDSTTRYYNARRGQFPRTRIGIVHKTRRAEGFAL